MTDRSFSEYQSWVARHPRNRTSLAREAIEFILRRTMTGNAKVWERGTHLRRFRDFVGYGCRLEDGDLDVDITLIDDEYGRPIQYRFHCNKTYRVEEPVYSSVRGLIWRAANRIASEKI